ncbi:hypothetical protein HW555_010374 [Spodoptera exigua]|uniref:Uncharacterized protein n=1 Tax=Spodoptera exigua TaxID=7107 RepID=A0A835G9K8_SPOEX|nr:hypothetical protein HW555_010374 [Spodoptera exigua]
MLELQVISNLSIYGQQLLIAYYDADNDECPTKNKIDFTCIVVVESSLMVLKIVSPQRLSINNGFAKTKINDSSPFPEKISLLKNQDGTAFSHMYDPFFAPDTIYPPHRHIKAHVSAD